MKTARVNHRSVTLNPISVPIIPTTHRRIEHHDCNLQELQSEHVLTNLISSGLFVAWRRRFREKLIISLANPMSRVYFKSTAEIHEEQRRHITRFYHIIHPLSSFTTTWESVMIIVYLLLILVVIPLELCFLRETPKVIMYSKLGLDFVSIMNIVISFFTGYVDDVKQKIELDQKKIIKNYIFGDYYVTGLFAVDVIFTLPITFLIYLTEGHDYALLKILFAMVLFRLNTMFNYINNYFVRRKFWSYRLKPLQLSLWIHISIMWCTSFTVFLHTLTDTKEITTWDVGEVLDYLINLTTKVIECLMLVGIETNELDDATQEQIIFTIVLIVLGIIINWAILAQVLRIYRSKTGAKNKHQKLLQEIGQYTTFKAMPPDLKEKMIDYVDFKYHRRILMEAEIMNTLSEILREELMLNKCQNLVERVDFFKDLPPALLMKIVLRLKNEVYLKNEVIFYAGAPPTSMYFVYVGMVGIYSALGKEVMHHGEGKHFGEISLMTSNPRLYTATAKSDTELLKLNRRDLVEILKPHPQILEKLTAIGIDKQKKLEDLVTRRSTIVTIGSILSRPIT